MSRQNLFSPTSQLVRAQRGVTAATKAPTCVITTASQGWVTGDKVYITNCAGMTQLNNREFEIAVLTSTTFELVGEDSTSHGVYTGGGNVFQMAGTLIGFNQGNSENQVPLLDATGKFHVDRIPVISGGNGGLVLSSEGRVNLTGLSSKNWVIPASTSRVQLVVSTVQFSTDGTGGESRCRIYPVSSASNNCTMVVFGPYEGGASSSWTSGGLRTHFATASMNWSGIYNLVKTVDDIWVYTGTFQQSLKDPSPPGGVAGYVGGAINVGAPLLDLTLDTFGDGTFALGWASLYTDQS